MMKINRFANIAVLAAIFSLFFSSSPALAALSTLNQLKEAGGKGSDQVEPVVSVAGRIAAIQQNIKSVNDKIATAKGMENAQSANRFKVGVDELKLRTSLLTETETIYQRQLASLTQQESLRKELALLEGNAEQGKDKTIDQKPPYSLDVYDYYLDQLSNATRQVDVAGQAISVGKNSLRVAKERLNVAKKNIRALAETRNNGESSLEWQKLLAEDGEELAQAQVDLQLINGANYDLELKLAELKKNMNQQNIDWLDGNLTFSQDELANHLAVIEERRTELEQRIDKLLGEQNVTENKWLAAQLQVDPGQGGDENKLAVDKAYLQARESWRETYQQVISNNNAMLQLLNREAQLWQRRYAFLKGETPTVDLKIWRQEARLEVSELSRALTLQQTYQNNVQAKIAATGIQLSKENIDPDIKHHLETSLQALNKLGERNFVYLTVLQGHIELDRRLIASIDGHLQEFNFTGSLDTVLIGIGSIWKYELFAVDSQAITVGKIIIAIIILIVGVILTGFVTRLIHRNFLVRLGLSVSATAITEKIIYYTALFVVTFIALRSVNIPMTAFTFLGGAVAIGVGFGAQKLINNFISGFILMIEQPIKVGDLVQMEGALGKIEDIGVRCTRVLTFDNVHLLVPNSFFLESNITNWTHTDNIVRGKVTVGVVYGSSTKLVKKQLLQAAREHGEVLNNPEPYVLFDDFGDNSLIFTVFFWVVVARVIDKRRIESDIRFIIEKLFREENLVIAFPQRDVHLDTSRPLKISIHQADDGHNQDEGEVQAETSAENTEEK